ncbi:MAG: hypothetical protein ACI4KI_06185 [Candidatus Fimenecus sp.]
MKYIPAIIMLIAGIISTIRFEEFKWTIIKITVGIIITYIILAMIGYIVKMHKIKHPEKWKEE